MKEIVLCGFTGSINRGTEAIAKSTADLFLKFNKKVELSTYNLEKDKKLGLKEFEKVIGYTDINDIKKNNILKYIYVEFQDKILKNHYHIYKAIQENILNELKNGIALNIGGDIYCYKEIPYTSYALNKYTSKNNIPNFFWGCSIEEDNVDDEMLKDLNRYNLIFPREILSYETLIKKGISKDKIFKMCDPAFALESEQVELPKIFNENKVIGINISPLVIKSGDSEIIWQNIYNVIDYIIKETKYDIALIPHVYDNESQDVSINKIIFEKYKNTNRIVPIEGEYNCRQIKYIISKCSFMIAARTHASIAAYSSEIPTLVIGYSVKSKGIATDLFGTYENYVIPAQNIKNNDEILEAFKWIMKKENEIKENLREKLPDYKKLAIEATKKIIEYCK